MPRFTTPISISDEERSLLTNWVRQEPEVGKSMATRANIVLRAAEGESNEAIAKQLGISRPTVALWRRRFLEGGIEALTKVKEGRGRKPSISEQTRRKIAAAQVSPRSGNNKPVRSAAQDFGVSPSTVHRIWSASRRTLPPPQASGKTQASGKKLFRAAFPSETFVGRDRDVAEVVRLLKDCRLATLTGPPGVGKTRLALEVAACVQADYHDGFCVVELGGVSENEVLARFVSALEAKGVETEPSVDSVSNHLASENILLVVDGCEGVLRPLGELLDEVIEVCPQVSILATSQKALGSPSEATHIVSPLDHGLQRAPGEANKAPAVELFIDRAKALAPASEVDDRSLPLITQICARLGGLPLAIDMAAETLAFISLQELADRVAEPFHILRSSSRRRPSRHRSLEAALDYSYRLLPEPEQRLLRRLSVFSGGFSLGSSEKVCSDDSFPASTIFGLLSGLIQKSLVVVATDPDKARYQLVEPIRSFAALKMSEAGEEPRLRDAHCYWCLSLAESQGESASTEHPVSRSNQLELEEENIRSALEWSEKSGRHDIGLRVAAAMAPYWWLRGRWSEGLRWLNLFLANHASAPVELLAKATWGAGRLAAWLGQYEEAQQLTEQSSAAAKEAGDKRAEARALVLQGYIFTLLMRLHEAIPILETSAKLARQTKDLELMADSFANLGYAFLHQGDWSRASAILEEALLAAEESHSLENKAQSLIGMGWALAWGGDPDSAKNTLREALQITGELKASHLRAEALAFLGEITRLGGDLPASKPLLEEFLNLARESQSPFLLGRALAGQARLAKDEGDLNRATAFFEEARSLAESSGLSFIFARCLHGLAEISLQRGDRTAAEESLEQLVSMTVKTEDKSGAAYGLTALSELALSHGNDTQAAHMLHEALLIQAEISPGAALGLLESVAGLAASHGHPERATVILAAASSIRKREAFPPCQCIRCHKDPNWLKSEIGQLHEALGAEKFEESWGKGSQLSLPEAVDFASRGRGPRDRPKSGWASLTPIEHKVVQLVIQGLSNSDIADRLVVSPRTVSAHLSHVYQKLSIESRRELRTLAHEHRAT